MYSIKKIIFIVVILAFSSATPVLAAEFQIITPYYGIEENTYQADQYGLKLKDSQVMKGLYFQSIDTEKYQWNFFIYQTENINYSDLLGVNFIYDYYFQKDNNIKNVLGIGMNYLRLDLAGENIPTSKGFLNGFNLDQDISSLYLRIGRYYSREQSDFNWGLMPWIGGQLDYIRGDGLIDFPGPGSLDFKVKDEQYSWIAGVNLKADFRHFLQLEAKHTITFNQEDYFNKDTAMINLFLNRNWSLSYRYSYQETTMGTDSYNIIGVGVLF